jgi:hypothetical protein
MSERKRRADCLVEIENRASRRDRRGGYCFPPLRVHDLARFFRFTYGGPLPDDDDGRECLFVLACHVVRLNGTPERNVRRYAAAWAPWMPSDELDAFVRRVLKQPYRWSADKLGRKLRLLDGVRTRLRITTIGSIDLTKTQRARRKRERQNAKRRRVTRAEYLDAALTRSRPWEAEAVCRRTWERRRRATALESEFARFAAFMRGGDTGAGVASPRLHNTTCKAARTCDKLKPIISPHLSGPARALVVSVLRSLVPGPNDDGRSLTLW